MDGNREASSSGPSWAREPERLLWAVRVRWAVIGGFASIALALRSWGLFPDRRALFLAVLAGTLGNSWNHFCVRRGRGVVVATVVALLMDNALITYASARSGGLHSPLVIMYSVQVVATAMLVTARAALQSAALAAVCTTALVLLESRGFTGPEFLFTATAGGVPAGAPRLAATAWGACLAYGLALLVFVGGFLSERLRRSESALAEQNRRLGCTVVSLAAARDELSEAYQRLQQAEAQLMHTEKMRALGQIVAGVAHELNNPISFISSNIDSLRDCYRRLDEFIGSAALAPEAEPARARLAAVLEDLPVVLDDCEEGARRAKQIVSELRTFARPADGGPDEQVDLNSCIRRTLRILRHRFAQDVQLDMDLREIPLIRGCGPQLEQVFLNLVANALDAVSGGGRIQLWSSYDPDAALVRATVRDDGPGIANEHLNRVFEPFFTTKPVGQGTGIGLSISYAIVRQHGGNLSVRSRPGGGAEFEVAIPGASGVNREEN